MTIVGYILLGLGPLLVIRGLTLPHRNSADGVLMAGVGLLLGIVGAVLALL